MGKDIKDLYGDERQEAMLLEIFSSYTFKILSVVYLLLAGSVVGFILYTAYKFIGG